MFEKFQISEKRELLLEALKEKEVFKENFQDLYLGSEVIRFPLNINRKYAGRDLVFVFPIATTEEKIEKLKSTELKVSYASPYYKFIKNEEVLKAVEDELKEIEVEFSTSIKPESITDFSALVKMEGDKGILIRNSYLPSRAISLTLGVKKSIYIPVLRLRVIHTDKEVRQIELKLQEKLEKFTTLSDALEGLERVRVNDLPENFLYEIEDIKYVKYKTENGVRTEEKVFLGKTLLFQAKREGWSALKFIEELLLQTYLTNRYTLKRKVDNIVVGYMESILSTLLLV